MMQNQKEKASALVSAFMSDNSGQMQGGINLVVTLTVAALVAAFLIPVAIDQLVSVDTTSWGSGASSLWEILDLIVVLAIFLFMIGLAVARSEM